MLKPGKYRHYKGNLYEVIGEAIHTETREPLVIYRSLYDAEDFPSGSLWVRPTSMFTDKVEVDGALVSRFQRLLAD